jgi:hypothetical protein
MDLNAPFLILNQALEVNRPTIIMVPGGEMVDAYILDVRDEHLVIEVLGVPFEARPWREGDKQHPLFSERHHMDAFSPWTVHNVEGVPRHNSSNGPIATGS